jgi:hypothetical protein
MNRAATVAFMLLVTAIVGFSESPPAVGARFKKGWAAGKERAVCMTQPAQLDPCVERVFDGVNYQVAYSEQKHRVTYLHTNDEKFRTAEGLKIGDSIPISQETVRAWPGWEVRAPMRGDGWWPIVGYDLPQIKLNDGTVLDLGHKEKSAGGMAVILGFTKGRP